jgi:mannose-6-phosphate isomerase-like protein (cupin superfamily)
MTHTRYTAVTPFQFESLLVRELTPDGLSSASIAEITVPSGTGHRRARSAKCDKLYACLTGEILFWLDGREVRLLPHDVLSIPRNHWFAYRNDHSGDARLLLMHVPPFDLAAEEFAEE